MILLDINFLVPYPNLKIFIQNECYFIEKLQQILPSWTLFNLSFVVLLEHINQKIIRIH